jgi:peptidyl-prolyl cis-trans isomerase B (cyclophilin B)
MTANDGAPSAPQPDDSSNPPAAPDQPADTAASGFVMPGQNPPGGQATPPPAPLPPGYPGPAPQPGQFGFARPAAKPRTGMIVGIAAAAIALVAIIAAGVWFVIDQARHPADFAGGETAEDHTLEPTAAQVTPPTVGDGAPAVDVVITDLTMSDVDGKPTSTDCEYRDTPQSQLTPESVDVGKPDDKAADSGTQDMYMQLNRGDVHIDVDNAKAPCTAASFSYLAGKDFFDDSACHRLTTEGLFILQCGDPSGTGTGGTTYQFNNEYVPEDTAPGATEAERASGDIEPNYPAGTVAMANAGDDTNSSQFFIVYDSTYLPPDYTIFGTVTEGMDVIIDIAEHGAVTP